MLHGRHILKCLSCIYTGWIFLPLATDFCLIMIILIASIMLSLLPNTTLEGMVPVTFHFFHSFLGISVCKYRLWVILMLTPQRLWQPWSFQEKNIVGLISQGCTKFTYAPGPLQLVVTILLQVQVCYRLYKNFPAIMETHKTSTIVLVVLGGCNSLFLRQGHISTNKIPFGAGLPLASADALGPWLSKVEV